MQGSYTASIIDEDYRKEQMYKKRKRNKCKDKPCEECVAFSVCTEVEEENEKMD